MRSMTGFGQASGENDNFRFTVTLRGVNHRFLDLQVRLREELRAEEPALRELLSKRLWRGRVEVSIETVTLGRREVAVAVDREMTGALKELATDLQAEGVIQANLGFGDLLRLPEVVRLDVQDLEQTAEDRCLLHRVVENALEQLIGARSSEGEKLAAAITERLDGLERSRAELVEGWRGMAGAQADALRSRITELLGDGDIEENRLAQEVAHLVDRSDVSEELDRLGSHLEQFRSIMAQGGTLGKRLDFLTQEIFRELNTLGSKCRDSGMTRLMLDAKVLCEQLREQVQNIE